MDDLRLETQHRETKISFGSLSSSFCYAYFDCRTCYLRYIYVKPQNKGLGSMLLNQVENEMRKQGCKQIKLQALPDTVNFYTKNGYSSASWWEDWWDYRPNFLQKTLA